MDKLPPLKIIARMHSDFPDKFGIPRQSGLVSELKSEIIFEPDYRFPESLRGLDEFSHLWVLWYFSQNGKEDWTPTVRPPRLGGNKRMGVFSTRSPYRPNPIGLSCVKIEKIEQTDNGPVITVSGADLLDGTPILDIKPYLPFTDCREDASGGFAHREFGEKLNVIFPNEFSSLLAPDQEQALIKILREDPRPSYQNDPERIYKMDFAEFKLEFSVSDDTLKITSLKKR